MKVAALDDSAPLSATGDALEAQPILDRAAARSSGADDGLEPATLWARLRRFMADPLVKQGAVNLALILTWWVRAGWQNSALAGCSGCVGILCATTDLACCPPLCPLQVLL